MIDWSNHIDGGIGAIIGSALTILGFKSRLENIEERHKELKEETHLMFLEIRTDIKTLIDRRSTKR